MGGEVGLDEKLRSLLSPITASPSGFNELYMASQFVEHGLQSAALRIFNIYGPLQDERLVIPRFVRNALRGDTLAVYGDGRQTRDFVSVKDVVRTALACADGVVGCEVINACRTEQVRRVLGSENPANAKFRAATRIF
jgi:nucleoside-diphosphate-sugar epimerase